jgi:hypothetical protein
MISFIVQGPYQDGVTNKTIDSIKKYYPGSEIIISSTNFKTDICYKTVLMENKNYDNWNFHIESSRAVNLAKHDLVCKVRSDVIFINSNLRINNENRFDTHKAFKSRITCGNYHFADPFISSLNYHPSDWLFFGRKEDVAKLFNIPPYTHESVDCGTEFTTKRGEIVKGMRVKRRPEQHFFLSALKNSGFDIDIKYDYDPSDLENGIKWIVNNFFVLDVGEMAGFYCDKYQNCVGKNYGYLNNENWNQYIKELT